MVVFLIEILAILFFWKFADLSKARILFPIALTGAFLRFIKHYIVVDWFHIWEIHVSQRMELLLPISADLTIWPVVCYLFIQYLPEKGKLLYGTLWVGIMLVYTQALLFFDVITMKKGWNLGTSALVYVVYFTLVYLTWRWLNQQRQTCKKHFSSLLGVK